MNYSIKGPLMHKKCPQRLGTVYDESIKFMDSLYKQYDEQIESVDIITTNNKVKVTIKFRDDKKDDNDSKEI